MVGLYLKGVKDALMFADIFTITVANGYLCKAFNEMVSESAVDGPFGIGLLYCISL